MQNRAKSVYISFDLIFDYQSYLFCLARSYLWQNGINLENSYRKKSENKNLEQIFSIINQECFKNQETIQKLQSMFDFYLLSIKPQIGALDMLKILKDQNYQIYSSIENYKELSQKLPQIKSINQEFFSNINFITETQQDIVNQIEDEQCNYNLVISGNHSFLEQIQLVSSTDIKLLYIQNTDFHNKDHLKNIEKDFGDSIQLIDSIENIKFNELLSDENISYTFPEKKYFLELQNKPTDISLEAFTTSVALKEKINIKSTIIQGQGKAGPELGIHTANLDIKSEENQEKIRVLPTGVYLGTSILKDTKYKTLFFIGSSQYFQTPMKQLECYLYGEFKEKFYDNELEITLVEFQRPEGDYKEFDHLIKTMHNDVWQGKQKQLE